MTETIFLAGATGVIGYPLAQRLVEAGYEVVGTTRSQGKADKLTAIGVTPAIVDVFDAEALEAAVFAAKPDMVLHQLTDLPSGLKDEEMAEGLARNARIREEGTRNLVAAAQKAGAKKFLAQSICFVYAPGEGQLTEEAPLMSFDDPAYGETTRAVASLEEQTLQGGFDTAIVLRNGWLYGANSGVDAPVDYAPPLHVDAAVQAAFLAAQSDQSGIYNVAEAGKGVDTSKFSQTFPDWSADYRV